MSIRSVFRYTRSNKINVKGFSTNTHSGSTRNDDNNMVQELLLRLGIPIIFLSGFVCYIKIQASKEKVQNEIKLIKDLNKIDIEMVQNEIKLIKDLNKINKEIVQNEIKAIKEMVKIDGKAMAGSIKTNNEMVQMDIKRIKDLIKESNETSIKMIKAYEDRLLKKG